MKAVQFWWHARNPEQKKEGSVLRQVAFDPLKKKPSPSPSSPKAIRLPRGVAKRGGGASTPGTFPPLPP